MERSYDDTETMLSPTGVVPIPPMAFGKYTLVARLGRGGMADVYLAIVAGPSGFRKLVAVKRLREAYEDDLKLVEMFMDEARLLARLEHPNLLHALDLGATDRRHFLATEFLEGQTLARTLRRLARRDTPVPVGVLLHIACEVLDGLHHAHELADFDGTPLGVVHRDVTPGNVVITYEGVVKLLDFGVAKSTTQMVETDPDMRKGKFAYLSPEQVEGRTDRRSDLFSLGVILWEALSGRRLFDAENPAATIRKVVSAPIPSLGSVCTDKLPPGLSAAIAKSLKRNAASRYQTAKEMRSALEAIAVREGLTMRRQELALVMAELFADLRADHGRDLSAAVAAGLHTATAAFELLEPLVSPKVARAADQRKSEPREGTAPTIPPPPPDSLVSWQRNRGPLLAVAAAVAALVALLVWVANPRDSDVRSPPAAASRSAPSLDARAATTATTTTLAPRAALDESDPELGDLDTFEQARAMGRDHYRAGRYADAIAAYEAATHENPTHAGSFAGLGASCLAADRIEAAIGAYQEAVRLAPAHSGFHAALGRAYRAAGRDDLARDAYRHALDLDVDNRAAASALAEIAAPH